jgi:hypothetical protein
MLFLDQPIQSFLNLGVCKEYATMAKPRVPKKMNGDTTATPVEAVSAGLPLTPANPTETTTTKPDPKRVTAKPSIVRTEGRANLVPINLDDEIRRLAYLLSERRGFEPGHESEDWFAAEREIRQRYRQQSA